MDLVLQILLLIVGFAMLVKGADWFVDGAAGIAGKLKIPQLVIGLTVVAFGTSAPELAVSLSAVLGGTGDVSLGNVVGSNIVNILLILGLSALFHSLPVQKSSRFVDLPFLLLISFMFVCCTAFDSVLGLADGIIFVVLLIAYVIFLILLSKKHPESVTEEEAEEPTGKFALWYEKKKERVWFLLLILVVGLALVILGANLSVNAAVFIAQRAGISDRVIGLTVIAIGTSLPELVTSVVAAKKGNTDIAVGNIIGSNIFNILMVAGLSSVVAALVPGVAPLAVQPAFVVDACIALGAAVLLFVFSLGKKHAIGKIGGVIMLLGFVGYFVYLFLA